MIASLASEPEFPQASLTGPVIGASLVKRVLNLAAIGLAKCVLDQLLGLLGDRLDHGRMTVPSIGR